MLIVLRGGPNNGDHVRLDGDELEGWLQYESFGVRAWYRRSDALEYAEVDGQRAEVWDYSDSGPPGNTS